MASTSQPRDPKTGRFIAKTHEAQLQEWIATTKSQESKEHYESILEDMKTAEELITKKEGEVEMVTAAYRLEALRVAELQGMVSERKEASQAELKTLKEQAELKDL